MNKKSTEIISFFKTDVGFFIVILLFVSFTSFFLGRLSSLENNNISNKTDSNLLILSEKKETDRVILVASKNGKVYHFPWCPGALRLKEENKIFFSSREEAEKLGYLPAKNCEGL